MKSGLLIVFLICGCDMTPRETHKPAATVIIKARDTIPAMRNIVHKQPVASYLIPVNAKLERYFGAKVYETPLTFHYLLQMQYEAILETDTLKIPDFGTWPVVMIKKGPEKQSCIIGFLDKEKQFKEYKMLSAKGNKLKLTTLKRYGTGVYTRPE